MIRLLILAAILAAPATGSAETVRVRSGEHSDFSRLLIEFDARVEWEFGRVEGGFEFRPARADIDYDLARVFDLIPRTRVADVGDRGNGHLFIASTCDCHGDAFDLRKGQVVLDLKDGPPPRAGSPFEAQLELVVPPEPVESDRAELSAEPDQPVPGSEISAEQERAGLPLLPVIGVQQQAPHPLMHEAGVRGRDEASGLPSEPTKLTEQVASPASAPASAPISDADAADPEQPSADRVSKTEVALLEQIARAATQGLLEADLSEVEKSVSDATSPVGASTSVPEAPHRPIPPVTHRGHVSIETSVDRAFGADAMRPARNDEGITCVNPVLLDIAGWGGPLQNGADIGVFRAKLVGEFDIANGEGITDLARHYVFVTFGAEAKALVRRYPDDVTRGDILVMMADIMDNGFSQDAMAYVDQMACTGPVALWAVLAQPTIYRGQSINTEAVALAFTKLPAHLRGHLGPKLADKFLAIDDASTADVIRNAISRTMPAPGGSFGLLEARFDLAEGDVAGAFKRLDDVMEGSDEHLPVALLERVEAALGAGQSVPADVITLLGSVAFERRGSEIGRRLIDAEIRALASASDFAAAFEKLVAAQQALPPQRVQSLRQGVFSTLVADGQDMDFLRHATTRLNEALGLPPVVRRELAKRFILLGFAKPARQVLGGEGAMPGRADRLLYAQVALLEGRPEVAIGYLAGLDDSAADRLRARALSDAKDHSSAVEAFGAMGDVEAQRRAAWLGGLWDTVSDLGDETEKDAARLMAPETVGFETSPVDGSAVKPEPPGAATPLALSQALIDSSREAREILEALLSDFAAPLS